MKYYIVHAFTNKQFGGNPAGICIVEEPLSDVQMQLIAAENNLPIRTPELIQLTGPILEALGKNPFELYADRDLIVVLYLIGVTNSIKLHLKQGNYQKDKVI